MHLLVRGRRYIHQLAVQHQDSLLLLADAIELARSGTPGASGGCTFGGESSR